MEKHCWKCKQPIKEFPYVTIRTCLGYNEPPLAENRDYMHLECYEKYKHTFMTEEEIAMAEGIKSNAWHN